MITEVYRVNVGFNISTGSPRSLYSELATQLTPLLDSENSSGPTIFTGNPACDPYVYGYATSLANATKAEDLICRILQKYNALIYRN